MHECAPLLHNVVVCHHAGANLDVDVPWKYLNFFLDDDAKLQTIGREYGAGRMFTGEVKKELIQVSAGMWPQCFARFVTLTLSNR